MPSPHSHIAVLVFAGVMLAVIVAQRLQRPLLHEAVEEQPITFRIDVNRADRDTLCLLPGVGPGIADRIISHRDQAGAFVEAADLESVSGIGTKTRAAIEPWVTFEEDG